MLLFLIHSDMQKIIKPIGYAVAITLCTVLTHAAFLFLFGTIPMIAGYQPSMYYLQILEALSFLVILPLLLFLLKRFKISPQLGTSHSNVIKILIIGILLSIVSIPLFNSMEFFSAMRNESFLIRSLSLKKMGLSDFFIIVNSIIIAPIIEELLYRGIIFNLCRKFSTLFFAVLSSTLLFTFSHFNPEAWSHILLHALVYTFVYYKTNSLLTSILLHSLINAISFFSKPSLIQVSTTNISICILIYMAAVTGTILIVRSLKGRGLTIRQQNTDIA
jgi:uncharacterized protein